MTSEELTEKYPLPDGVKWDGMKIRGALPGSMYPQWHYGWVFENRNENGLWQACLWINQKISHIESATSFKNKEEAINFLWLKFVYEHNATT